jgi:hypothetical protein
MRPTELFKWGVHRLLGFRRKKRTLYVLELDTYPKIGCHVPRMTIYWLQNTVFEVCILRRNGWGEVTVLTITQFCRVCWSSLAVGCEVRQEDGNDDSWSQVPLLIKVESCPEKQVLMVTERNELNKFLMVVESLSTDTASFESATMRKMPHRTIATAATKLA